MTTNKGNTPLHPSQEGNCGNTPLACPAFGASPAKRSMAGERGRGQEALGEGAEVLDGCKEK